MNILCGLCCLLLFAVSTKAQVFICHGDDFCGSETGRGSDEVDCCQHGVAPFGLSFSIEGAEACNLCPIDFGFVNPTFTAPENTTTYTVELAFFSGASPLGGFFLTLQLETITATPDDIGFTFNRVFFPSLSGSNGLEIRTAEIQLRLDSTAQESNETFRLTFPRDEDLLPGATLRDTFNGVIVDATRIEFELSEEDYREREGDTGFMPVVITKDSQVVLANPVTFLVIPWTVEQAEAEGLVPSVITVPDSLQFSPNRADAEDFNISRITVVFATDERNPMTDLNVPIPVVDDLVDEANDQYFVTEFRVVTAANLSLISLQQRASRCRIVDNDPLTIGFQLSQYDYFEPETGSTVFMNVTLVKEDNVASEQTFGVNIAYGDPGGSIGVATLEQVDSSIAFDYVVGSPGDTTQTLLFPPQASAVIVSFTLFADDLAEGTEGFRATLSPESEEFPNFALPDPNSMLFQETLIRIFDSDIAVVGFERPSYTVSENSENAEVCIILRSPAAFQIILEVIPTAVTADSSDFSERPAAVSFERESMDNRTCARIRINQDDLYEDTEVFNATLRLFQETTGVVIDQPVTQVFIIDETNVTFGFNPAVYSIDESDQRVVFNVTLVSGVLARNVEIEFFTEDGSATAGDDYIGTVTALTFGPDVSFVEVVVDVDDDDLWEIDESFFGNLRLPEGGEDRGNIFFQPGRAMATIRDEDTITIGFVRETDSIAENTPGSIDLCVVVLSGMLERSATVTVATADAGEGLGFASGGGVDYSASPLDFTFTNANRDIPQCLPVTIINDQLLEGNEVFLGMLSNTNSIPRLLLDPQSTTVTIADTDDASIGFVNTPYREREDNGPAVITVETRGDLQKEIDVMVFTEFAGSAITDVDFFNTSTIITFNQTVNVISVDIPLIDDEFVEGDETLSVRIAIITDGNIQLLTPDTELVTILDDDRVVIGLDETMVSVTEDVGRRELCASIISGIIMRDVLVNVVYEDRNARDVEDYNADPRVLTFSPGVDSVCFNVSIVDDDRFELDEDFIVNITTTDPQAEVNPMTTLVSIMDDEILVIGWELPEYSVAEADGEVEICAVVSGATQAVTLPRINILPVDNTGTTPGDYGDRPDPRFFDFQSNTPTRMCTRITIAMDGILEPTESFFADLADIPTQRVVYNPQRTTIVIADSDDAGNNVIEVNDTVIGDPLFTVPILVPEEQLAALNLTRLTMCYEIHGRSEQWFNLVTDECTSVNARYDDLNEDLNIIDEIGVRTVDSAGRCLNIGVNVEQCAVQINGAATDRYSRDGVSVRRYGNRRVRISVPNCNDYMLVMWVICEQRTLDDPFQPGLNIMAEMIKFVVMRGLNTGHRPAHGLLGQFWNIPVSVARFTGPFRQGVEPDSRLVLNLTTPGSQPRSFTGWLYDLTWELEVTPCLYVGNRQAGHIYEVMNPNDEVIAEFYKDYQVASAFSEENYRFGMFDESNCALGPDAGGESTS